MILGIDQGTTGTTCLIVDDDLRVRGRGYRELRQEFPRPGWVEQDPEELWQSVLAAAAAALEDAECPAADLTAVGVANQRETTVLWNRATGRAVAPAIVWQDRRTAARCRELDQKLIRSRTGLVPDPYFAATKLEWLLREHHGKGLAFGTVDSWLVWKLTGGAMHVTDRTNAARTLLCSLETLDWDDELIELFGIERTLLPQIVGSSGPIGEAELFGTSIPLCGLAGDQQAALYGQGCHRPGEGKATYGTGTFVLVHAGPARPAPPGGLLATAAADGYALEGAVLASGAAVQWLKDGLGVLADVADSDAVARSIDSTEGVAFVPALAGLGSPWWDPDARGLVTGITRGTTRAQLVRAALEGIAHQVADVIDALPERPAALRADGGATANTFLMQFQADLLGVPVEVAAEREATALGAAALAAGTTARGAIGVVYEPRSSADRVEFLRSGWADALARARGSRADA